MEVYTRLRYTVGDENVDDSDGGGREATARRYGLESSMAERSPENQVVNMQQPGQMFPVMPSFPPTNITTEQIQKYLDENKKLILAILDNQNLGKLAECAQYQAQLQKNLMYLAAIADAQPQTPAMPTQMTPHPGMQQGGFYMPQQHPQAAAMAQQQQGLFPPRGAPPFNIPHHPLQDPQVTSSQGHQMGLRPVGPNNGHNNNNNNNNDNSSLGGGTSNSGLHEMLGGGSKQDKAAAASSDAAQGNSAAGDGDEAQ
ncbi:grf1-interacting factor 3 [Phtheirospermum japonicum]|uniref:Grf1-interacting factor 3 n=1 Tax=Phtheirospermum japonicum TaxID=374723 RepID=A0A830CSE8_9LAMI|nr:grf1-interacting factor 3 [Phtheirospermum japonicum]